MTGIVMDYLDIKKQRRHQVILFTGYGLIAIAIGFAATILLYQSYGFGIKGGAVVQNGLTFFSSQPSPANIYINNVLKDQTNTRLALNEGIYNIKLTREGYRDWQRTIEVDGGSVHHFDYPFLVPTSTTTKDIAALAPPPLATQSPDRRWLLLEQPDSLSQFTLYDFKNAQKPVTTTVSLPANVLSDATGSESLALVEWADDNRRVLLKHSFDDTYEYILLDRAEPDQSVNVSTALSANPPSLSLLDKKYDQYYLFDQAAGTLQSASLSEPTPKSVLQNVIAFKSYSDNMVLYATNTNAPAGKVAIRLTDGKQTYPIRTFDAGSTYLLDLTEYSRKLYVVAGAANQNKVYIYADPVGQLRKPNTTAVSPEQVLHVTGPTYVSFSTSAQYIMAQNGTQFGVYDIENSKGYNYNSDAPLDAPQTHANWMDGNRLSYVSGGKLTFFDYDNLNHQSLMAANSNYLPAFTSNYAYVYTFTAPATDGKVQLQQTSLRTPADQ
jgi:hypothetical protein